MAGDGELIGEEATAEEVLVPEAIAVGSSLERVLDLEAGTMALRGGSNRNEGGQWWCSLASRGEMERGSSSDAHTRDKDVEESACGAVVTGVVR
jgi:hypothetical protein